MHIGMTYEQYWNADPYLTIYYRKAHRIKMEEQNQLMWMQGAYNYRAFEAVIGMFSYGLGGKKGRKPEGYIKKPLDIFGKDEEKPPTQSEIDKTRKSVIDRLNQWKSVWDRKNMKRGENANGN